MADDSFVTMLAVSSVLMVP